MYISVFNLMPWLPFLLTTQLNYLASLAKWLSVRLRTKWLWVRIQLQSLKLQFLDIQATIECGFTLKPVHGMMIIYSLVHLIDKYSQHSSIVWPVWLNGWVFVYELSGYGFESSCSHLNGISMKITPHELRNRYNLV